MDKLSESLRGGGMGIDDLRITLPGHAKYLTSRLRTSFFCLLLCYTVSFMYLQLILLSHLFLLCIDYYYF